MKISMGVNETKKCRIVPKKYNFIPDLLLQNKRIEEDTIMDLNKAEISRALSLASVFMIKDDASEVLLTPKNFYIKGDGVDIVKTTPEPVDEAPARPVEDMSEV